MTDIQDRPQDKKAYHKPTLHMYGDIQELTQTGPGGAQEADPGKGSCGSVCMNTK